MLRFITVLLRKEIKPVNVPNVMLRHLCKAVYFSFQGQQSIFFQNIIIQTAWYVTGYPLNSSETNTRNKMCPVERNTYKVMQAHI